jgi:hypothetical protein
MHSGVYLHPLVSYIYPEYIAAKGPLLEVKVVFSYCILSIYSAMYIVACNFRLGMAHVHQISPTLPLNPHGSGVMVIYISHPP